MKSKKRLGLTLLLVTAVFSASPVKAYSDEDSSRNILKQGLLGAGTGAIASSASGGNAGKGALIGAGTNVIGGALLDTLFSGGSSQQPRQQQVVYAQQPQVVQSYPAQQGYVEAQPVYVQQAPVYQQPQEDPTAPQQQYQQYPRQRQLYANQGNVSNSQLKKKIIRKYDSDGHVVSEEEIWE